MQYGLAAWLFGLILLLPAMVLGFAWAKRPALLQTESSARLAAETLLSRAYFGLDEGLAVSWLLVLAEPRTL